MTGPSLPPAARLLGLAGLLPQLLCLGAALAVPEHHWLAVSAACFYAATILSFLGGMWWMQGLAARSPGAAPFLLGVLPSLAGWAALLPWCLGWNWPGPSLLFLGVLLASSPLGDALLIGRLALPAGWMRLRWTLALGLGGLSVATGLAAIAARA